MTSPLSVYREQVRQWIREQHDLGDDEPIDETVENAFMCEALRGKRDEDAPEVIAFRTLLAEFQHDVVAPKLEPGVTMQDTILSTCTKTATHMQPCVCPFLWYRLRKQVVPSEECTKIDENSSSGTE